MSHYQVDHFRSISIEHSLCRYERIWIRFNSVFERVNIELVVKISQIFDCNLFKFLIGLLLDEMKKGIGFFQFLKEMLLILKMAMIKKLLDHSSVLNLLQICIKLAHYFVQLYLALVELFQNLFSHIQRQIFVFKICQVVLEKYAVSA